MLEAQKQQHLRALRRGLNRAVTSLKEGGRVVCHSGWAFGLVHADDWLADRTSLLEFGADREPHLLLPAPDCESFSQWADFFPEESLALLQFFWPGPLWLRIKTTMGAEGEERSFKMTVSCPWHPLMKELLSRHGALFWSRLGPKDTGLLREGKELPERGGVRPRVLLWPEKESELEPTLLDISTWPWRIMEQGFVEADELIARAPCPVLLSGDRAFPIRPVRKYVPEGKTVILEADTREQLPAAVQQLREQVPPDAFVRIYLDESVAHNHFPDDREVRVYGELSDPERVRRRLQAMLERQSRRFGKRILLIGVSGIEEANDSFRADLEKLSDGWLKVEEGKELSLEDVSG